MKKEIAKKQKQLEQLSESEDEHMFFSQEINNTLEKNQFTTECSQDIEILSNSSIYCSQVSELDENLNVVN